MKAMGTKAIYRQTEQMPATGQYTGWAKNKLQLFYSYKYVIASTKSLVLQHIHEQHCVTKRYVIMFNNIGCTRIALKSDNTHTHTSI